MALAHYSPPALIRAIVQGTSLTTVVRLPPQDWLQDRTKAAWLIANQIPTLILEL